MLRQIRIYFSKTSIAWAQLKYQKGQTTAAILGIAFTTILIFMQIGFRSSFLNSLTALPESFQGDLFVMSSASETVLRPEEFSRRRLDQLRKFNAVESVAAIYLGAVSWKNPNDPSRNVRQISIVGFPPRADLISLPGVNENIDQLKLEDSLILDWQSRPELDGYVDRFKEQGKFSTEINVGRNSKQVNIAGLFKMGTSTSANCTLIGSEETFHRIFNNPQQLISIGIVKLKSGFDADETLKIIKSELPDDIRAISKRQMIMMERNFYENKTPIGLIFRFGLLASILVGIIILYQILYIKVSKHLTEYATLKAIGYQYSFLKNIVLKEALILAILGYIPGLLLSILMYDFLKNATRMSFIITLNIVVVVFVCISLICFTSALIAIKKVKEANPADIF